MDKINNNYVNNKKITKNLLKFLIFNIFLVFFLIFYVYFDNFFNFLYKPNFADIYNINNAELFVNFIDVGQADCCFVVFANKKTMLVDFGLDFNNESHSKNSTKNVLEKYFSDKEKTINYLIATHPDYDHIGNFKYIFEEYKVENFFRPNIYTKAEAEELGLSEYSANICEKQFYAELIDCVKNSGAYDNVVDVVSRSNVAFKEADCSVDFLTPLSIRYDDLNDYSLVTKLTYKGKSFLLTGDITENVEENLTMLYSDSIKCDVLKVAHHGSGHSSSENFIKSICASFAVISCGDNNDYFHPAIKTLKTLNLYLPEDCIIKTSEYGNILFGVNSDGELCLQAQKIKFFEVHKVSGDCVFVVLECIAIFMFIKRMLYILPVKYRPKPSQNGGH